MPAAKVVSLDQVRIGLERNHVRLLQLFSSMETNKDGRISIREARVGLRRMLADLGYDSSPALITALTMVRKMEISTMALMMTALCSHREEVVRGTPQALSAFPRQTQFIRRGGETLESDGGTLSITSCPVR